MNEIDVFPTILTDEEAIAEANRCLKCTNPRCTLGCPAKQKIPQFIQCVADGNLQEAMEIIIEDNPFPITTANICPGFCENGCILGIKGNPIKIRLLKKYVVENANLVKLKIKKSSGKKVAIIGSGPSGLTTAFYLSKDGHEVTVFEKLERPGGMLFYAVPRFRLSEQALINDISLILRSGLKILFSKEIENINSILNDFDAIYVATGSWIPRKMNIIGEDKTIQALDFLIDVNTGKNIAVGRKTVVIGGGNVAIDAARTALRCGAKDVRIIYRRTEKEMPCLKEELEKSKKEGVIINFLSNPVEIGTHNVKVVKMKLGAIDESGRARPIPIENSEEIVEADTILVAIGQRPVQMDISSDKVFAGGDFVNGSTTAVQAIADGKKYYYQIKKYLEANP